MKLRNNRGQFIGSKPISKECLFCKRKYCSRVCSSKDHNPTWLPKYKKGCTSTHKGDKTWINSGTFKKGHQGMKGKFNPAWKHGLSKKLKGFYERHRELRKKTNGGTHSYDAWEVLKIIYRFTCPSCLRKEPNILLTEDHIKPIFKGGMDDIKNIQPLCMDCNNKKFLKEIKYKYPWVSWINGSYLIKLAENK